jgi:hypothetical protein
MDTEHRPCVLRDEKNLSQNGKDARFLNRLGPFLAVISEADRELLLSFIENVTRKPKGTEPKN